MWIQERPQHTAMPLSNATKMEKICSGKTFGALLTDLSKAFDCLDHEIIIFHIENIEHGLIIHIVNDWLLCLGYHKAQFWHHFYSTFFWQICFLYLVILILKTLQMIIRHIILLKM